MAMGSLKTEMDDCCSPCEPNPYGYSTSISLNEEQIKAMGLPSLPEPGQQLEVQALAFVTHTMVEKEQEDGKTTTERRLCLQFTDMSLKPTKTAVDAMYGESGDD